MAISAQDLLRTATSVAALRGTPKGEEMARVFREAYLLSENYNYDFQTNGELAVLRKLSGLRVRTIFDVGANVGEWTKLALTLFPESQVYAFEPIPETYLALKASCGSEPRAGLFPYAIAKKDGEISLRYYKDHPGQTSFFEFPSHLPHQTVSCVARSLDSVAREEKVEQIDLLKIDVEGAEHLVLGGAGELLVDRRIRIVQFEYGMININSRFLLKDFYSFFQSMGFRVGKLYPNFVDFSDYTLQSENFIGPNFIAVTTAEPEIFKALG